MTGSAFPGNAQDAVDYGVNSPKQKRQFICRTLDKIGKEQLRDIFINVTMLPEFVLHPSTPKIVRHWTDELRYYIADAGYVADVVNAEIHQLSFSIHDLTGITITKVNSIKNSNLAIYLIDENEISILTRKNIIPIPVNRSFNCYARVFWKYDQPSVIRFADLFIATYLDKDEIAGCVNEEISQILGVLNDYNMPVPSMFDDRQTAQQSITDLDKSLLNILYSYSSLWGKSGEELSNELDIIINLLSDDCQRNRT